MKKEKKQKIVSEIKKGFDDSTVAVVVDYSGMKVKEVTDLKRKLRTEGATLQVLKNTLINRALTKEELGPMKVILNGPTAVMLGFSDPLLPMKILAKFIKENEKPRIKGGVFEGKASTAAEIIAISKLPGRKELIAKAVGGIKSPLNGLVFTLSGTLRGLVYALSAIKDKKQ